MLKSLGRLVILTRARRSLSYAQGQASADNLREYFYYVDHNGQLFLDDAKIKNFTCCFKDKDFLAFFFNRLEKNRTGRYEGVFPYVSPCGRERNFVRCDDRPIVYTQILLNNNQDGDRLSYCNTGHRLTVPFHPEKLFMCLNSGRIYYPAPEKVGGVGLLSSHLAIELGGLFEFPNTGEEPKVFKWRNNRHSLTKELEKMMAVAN